MTPERFDELRASTVGNIDRTISSELNEALDAIAEMSEEIYVPGGWECPKCNFLFVGAALNGNTGTVVVNRKHPDSCPNDGAPMRPCTWKRDAKTLAKMLTEKSWATWRKLSREKPTDRQKVLLCDFQVNPPKENIPLSQRDSNRHPGFWNIREAVYVEQDNEWDHDNWHRSIEAKPNDFWMPLPPPPASRVDEESR